VQQGELLHRIDHWTVEGLVHGKSRRCLPGITEFLSPRSFHRLEEVEGGLFRKAFFRHAEEDEARPDRVVEEPPQREKEGGRERRRRRRACQRESFPHRRTKERKE